jgi:hypothetical protein
MSGASKKLITYPAVYRIGEHQAITQQGKSHTRLSQSGRALIPRARRLSPDGLRSSRTEHGVRLSGAIHGIAPGRVVPADSYQTVLSERAVERHNLAGQWL